MTARPTAAWLQWAREHMSDPLSSLGDADAQTLFAEIDALAARCRAVEQQRDEREAVLSALTSSYDALVAEIDEELPAYVLDDGSGDEANPRERVEYAGDELRRGSMMLVAAESERDEAKDAHARAVVALGIVANSTPFADLADILDARPDQIARVSKELRIGQAALAKHARDAIAGGARGVVPLGPPPASMARASHAIDIADVCVQLAEDGNCPLCTLNRDGTHDDEDSPCPVGAYARAGGADGGGGDGGPV